MKYLLTIETTCDETAAAVIDNNLQVLSSVVASQDALHSRFGGVVPEIASRAHLERILPVIDEALQRAEITLDQLDAVAVANTPGLAGSLLVGLVAAKTLAMSLNIPLVAVNHLQAHVYACRMHAGIDVFPCVGLIVSGGHTSLYHCKSAIDFQLLGGTIDDAAGEAFDKVASMLGLPYPGGPAVQRTAEQGDATAHKFPRSFLNDKSRLQFSFSGLKTAVRYAIAGPGTPTVDASGLSEQQIADLAASFQQAVIDCLVVKSLAALKHTRLKRLCVAGGVAANSALREQLEQAASKHGYELHVPPLRWCTDNAAMGAIAWERFQAGLTEELDLEILPGLVR